MKPYARGGTGSPVVTLATLLLVHHLPAVGVKLSSKTLHTVYLDNSSSPNLVNELAYIQTQDGGEGDNIPPQLQHETGLTESPSQPTASPSEYPRENVIVHFDVKTIGNLSAVSATMKGRMPTNDDEITTLKQLSENVYYMGLFDGHKGSETSKYLRRHAHEAIAKGLDIQPDIPCDFNEEAIAHACIELDKKMIGEGVCKDSGSTAAMLLVERDMLTEGTSYKLHAINIGDTRVIVMNPDSPTVVLTEIHKPDLPHEAARIKAAGGSVYNLGGVWRVEGILPVSRSFGDAALKDYSSQSDREQKVVALPGQQEMQVSGKSLIILACGGMFGTVDLDLPVVFKAALEESGGRLVDALRSVMLALYMSGSEDSLSAIVAMMHAEVLPASSHRFTFVPG